MDEHTRDILTMLFVTLFSLGGGLFLILWPWIERRLPKLPMGLDAFLFSRRSHRFMRFLGVLSILYSLLFGATLLAMLK